MAKEKKVPEEGEDVYLVYAYSSEQRYHYYEIPSLDVNDGRSAETFKLRSYPKKPWSMDWAGGIHKAKNLGNSISYNRKAPMEATWKNSDDRVKWRAMQVVDDEQKKALNEAKRNLMKEALSPVADAYRRAGYSEKRLILAEVIRIVTGGRE